MSSLLIQWAFHLAHFGPVSFCLFAYALFSYTNIIILIVKYYITTDVIYFRFTSGRVYGCIESILFCTSVSVGWHTNRRRPLWLKLWIVLSFRCYNIFLISDHVGSSEFQREAEKNKYKIKLHRANADFVYYTLKFRRSARYARWGRYTNWKIQRNILKSVLCIPTHKCSPTRTSVKFESKETWT